MNRMKALTCTLTALLFVASLPVQANIDDVDATLRDEVSNAPWDYQGAHDRLYFVQDPDSNVGSIPPGDRDIEFDLLYDQCSPQGPSALTQFYHGPVEDNIGDILGAGCANNPYNLTHPIEYLETVYGEINGAISLANDGISIVADETGLPLEPLPNPDFPAPAQTYYIADLPVLQQDARIYGITGQLALSYINPNLVEGASIEYRLTREPVGSETSRQTVRSFSLDLDDSVLENAQTGILDIAGPSAFPFSIPLGSGFDLKEGWDMQLEVFASYDPGAHIIAYFQDDASFIEFFGETIQTKVWTENKQGQATTAFPAGNTVDTTERTVDVHIAGVGLFGERSLTKHTPQIFVHDENGVRQNDWFSVHPTFDGNSPGTDSYFPAVSASPELGGVFVGSVVYPENVQDGTYTIFVSPASQQWNHQYEIEIGGHGFEIELLENDLTSRVLNAGQSTVYSVKVTNIGTTTDSVNFLASGLASGWSGFFKDTEFENVPAGESRFTSYTLTPGPAVITGATSGFLFAQSEASGVATSVPIDVTITSTVIEGVQVYVDTPVEMKPGQTRIVPISVVNTGTASDQYVVSASDIPLGWLANIGEITPTLPAQSQLRIQARVTAPLTALPGDVETINVHANAIGDDLIQDTINVVFQVLTEENHELRIVQGSQGGEFDYVNDLGGVYTQSMRDEGPDANPDATFLIIFADDGEWDADSEPDIDFDASALVPVEIYNSGDTADSYSISGRLSGANHADCDGDNGHPANWRVGSWDETETPITAGNRQPAGESTPILQPGESFTVFYEVRWSVFSTDVDCPTSSQNDIAPGARQANPADTATLRLTSRSGNDPTDIKTVSIIVDHEANGELQRTGNGQFSGASRNIALHVENVEQKLDVTTAGAFVEYDVVMQNLGNELDTARLEFPTNLNGWDLTVESFNIDHVKVNDVSPGVQEDPARSVRAMDCIEEVTSNDVTLLDCSLGIGDRATAVLRATPTSAVEIGDKLKAPISLTSGDTLADGLPGVVKDVGQIEVTATGSYLFDLKPNKVQNTIRATAGAGETIRVPVWIENQGTQDDRFLLQFSNAGLLDGWLQSISHQSEIFVPAGREVQAYVTVTPPANAAIADKQFLQLQATSLDGPENLFDLIDIQVEVVAQTADFASALSPATIIVGPGSSGSTQLDVGRLAGNAASVTYEIDSAHIPAGWSVNSLTGTKSYVNDALDFDITVNTAEDALATSKAMIPILLEDSNEEQRTEYLLVSFSADSVGLDLNVEDGVQEIVPGDTTELSFTLTNNGNSVEQVDLTFVGTPTGWDLTFEEDFVVLQPLQTRELFANVTPSLDVEADLEAQVVIRAEARDSGLFDTVAKLFRTTTSDLSIRGFNQTISVAPTEEVAFHFTVVNTGTATDEVSFAKDVLNVYEDLVDATFSPESLLLGPDEQGDVRVSFNVSTGLPSDFTFDFGYTASSIGPYLDSEAGNSTAIRVLPYVALDIDQDLIDEFAIDRDVDEGFDNGFDEFIEQANGKQSSKIDMEIFLTNESRLAWTLTEEIDNETRTTFNFMVDGDDDGRQDFFIDATGNGLPDIYWAPSRGLVDQLEIIKDVTEDGIPEYFVDVNNDGLLDVFYDVTTGIFGNLIKLDVNDDGNVDYGVDLDQDGILDDNEPVFFTEQGRITRTEERIDVDGDGNLDLVIDEDGDGDVDLFVPHGQETGIRIVLKDVTGDGILDWTFDADGKEGRESFYDPATGESGIIDTNRAFGDLVEEYWYVGALFVLVAVLFIVLIAVTRRQ